MFYIIIIILLIINAIMQFYIFRLMKSTKDLSKNIDITKIMSNFDSDFWGDSSV